MIFMYGKYDLQVGEREKRVVMLNDKVVQLGCRLETRQGNKISCIPDRDFRVFSPEVGNIVYPGYTCVSYPTMRFSAKNDVMT